MKSFSCVALELHFNILMVVNDILVLVLILFESIKAVLQNSNKSKMAHILAIMTSNVTRYYFLKKFI